MTFFNTKWFFKIIVILGFKKVPETGKTKSAYQNTGPIGGARAHAGAPARARRKKGHFVGQKKLLFWPKQVTFFDPKNDIFYDLWGPEGETHLNKHAAGAFFSPKQLTF